MSELQRGRQEQETESKQSQEERRRLQVELGHLQAQLETANSHLQQARDRYVRTICMQDQQPLHTLLTSDAGLFPNTGRLSTHGQQLNSSRRRGR